MRDKKLHPKLTAVIIAAFVAIVTLTGVALSRQNHAENTQKNSSTQTQHTVVQTGLKTVSYDGVEGKNALELLKSKATVTTKQSSYGEYVDTVNGVQGGTDGKYWTFYINGKMAQVGAADYKTKDGDKIEWKFE